MSDQGPPSLPPGSPAPPLQPSPSAPPPEAPRSGCLTAIMVLSGIVMLLPGLCALIFGATFIAEPSGSGAFMPLVLLGLAIGFGGVMLIWSAVQGRPR